jgi:hypothetical protein
LAENPATSSLSAELLIRVIVSRLGHLFYFKLLLKKVGPILSYGGHIHFVARVVPPQLLGLAGGIEERLSIRLCDRFVPSG